MTMTDFKILLVKLLFVFGGYFIVSYAIRSVIKSIKAYHPDRLKTNPEDTAELEASAEADADNV